MEKQQFLAKFEELQKPVNDKLLTFVNLLIRDGKTKKEIAKAIRKRQDVYNSEDTTIVSRRLKEVCKHFDIKFGRGNSHQDKLVHLFRQHMPDFVHPDISPDGVDSETLSRPQFPTNPQNIPNPESIPELKNLEFIGRDNEVGYIHHLTAQGAKCILILGAGGVGKTTLARNYLKQSFDLYIEFSIAKERQNIASIASLVEEKLRFLNEESGREFMVSLERLKSRLQRERIGVLIDNLEPALDRNGQFVEEHRSYVELLRVLNDSSLRSTTLITSREALNEALDIQTLMLGGLKENVWKSFLIQQGINVDISVLTEMHKAFGGNALAMKILCTPIKTYHDGDLAAYWRECKTESGLVVEQALENLIREQFDRLQSNCPELYKLLCRMGCFRYQDVPTVPKEGLISLLWDVVKSQHIRVINALRERSLIEFDKGEYFLHPAIRAEAISRLRSNVEWKEVNQKVSEFWEITIADTNLFQKRLNIFEAFYHYYIINSYEKAFLVFTLRVKIGIYERKLYAYLRFWGYASRIADCLKKLVNKLDGINKTDVLGIIGVCYYYNNDYRLAIQFLEKAKYFIESEIDYRHQRLQSDCLNYLACSYHFLGESTRAIEYCKKALIACEKIDLREEIKHERGKYYFERMNSSCLQSLAFIFYELGEYDQSFSFSEEAFQWSKPSNQTEILYREAGDSLATKACALYGQSMVREAIETMIQSIHKYQLIKDYISEGYSRCCLIKFYLEIDLKESEQQIIKVEDIYNNGYKSTVLLTDLYSGKAQFSRKKFQIEKRHSYLSEAISDHLECIKLLSKIEVKPELAEEYFQLGLTYQAMGEYDQAEEYKAKALELFAQMEAPKQIERVNKAFGDNIQ